MSSPAKFMFDMELNGPKAPPPIAHDEVEALKASHAAELTRVRQEALQLGRQEGRAEAEKTLDHELFKMLDKLVEGKEQYQREVDAKLEAARSSTILLAMTIARKLADSLLARYPADHIEEFFQNTLSLLPHKTALRLHVAPHLASTLQPRLEALLERNGQVNALQTVPDETIEGVDCRLVWIDGGIEQDTREIFNQIEKMIATCLYSQSDQHLDHTENNTARVTL